MRAILAPIVALAFVLVAAAPVSASIRCVQENLAVLGYNPGPVDGILGPRTRAEAGYFARDRGLSLPPLSESTIREWCMAVLGPVGGARAVARMFREPVGIGPDNGGCVANPADAFVHEISGLVDGDELTLAVSAQFGGAVESVVWRDKEFINIFDHGRQISYAWALDDYGGCLNPTEPGSGYDMFELSSTSELLSACSPAPNTVTTRTLPAYWVPPGEPEGQGGFCSGGATHAVNQTAVADQPLEKTITLGYRGLDNVIVFDADITLPEDFSVFQAEIPTAYLTHEFTSMWRLNPLTGELARPEGVDPPAAPWSFMDFGNLPPILATPDGAYAMGAYTAESIVDYSILKFDSPLPADKTNKWNMVVREEPAPAGTYRYRSFAIVGTLEGVTESMMALYQLHPSDFNPPEGYVDLANCSEIAGWAWDPKAPNQPIAVEVYSVDGDAGRTLLASTLADIFRADLPPVFGDNGRHGYSLPTPRALRDGEMHTIHVEAVNSLAGLANRRLLPEEHRLRCPSVAD